LYEENRSVSERVYLATMLELEVDTDGEVIGTILAGRTEAYRFLVERYQNRLIGFCRSRLGSEEEARDAAQEVFVRAYTSLGSFRSGESFASWLFAIAANRLKTRGERRRVEGLRVKAAGREEAARPAGEDPATIALRSLEAEAVRSAVAELPEELRMTVQLYYFAGLSVEECGKALGLGREAVKSRLFRARGRLRVALEVPAREEGRDSA
jgi:RNA polymerase sigma-70 factor (ECF subfamily)